MEPTFNFEQLSSQVDPTQRQILTAIWKHYWDKKQWPLTMRVHHDFKKPTVLAALKQLGGMVVREVYDSGKQRYQLTFLGILLTDQGNEIEQLIVRYLAFLQKKFDAEPELETISSMEIELTLGLTYEQSQLLGKVAQLSYFLGISGYSDTGWSACFPNDIDEFSSDSDLTLHLRSKAIDKYDPAFPIDERGRVLYSSSETDDKELEQKFKILLSPNQAALDFEAWSNNLKGTSQPIAVLFVDIDHFKALNSRHTEPKIDQTILPEAQHLLASLACFRGRAYKHGGDEFVLILPNHDASEAQAFAERVRSHFAEHQFTVDGDNEKLTLSGGIAVWPQHGEDYQQVLQRASEAKRRAKESRNTVLLAGFGG